MLKEYRENAQYAPYWFTIHMSNGMEIKKTITTTTMMQEAAFIYPMQHTEQLNEICTFFIYEFALFRVGCVVIVFDNSGTFSIIFYPQDMQ